MSFSRSPLHRSHYLTGPPELTEHPPVRLVPLQLFPSILKFPMKQKDSKSVPADMEAVQKSLEGLSLEQQITKLSNRVVQLESSNANLIEKANQVDQHKKAVAQLEKKLEKANSILLRTEEAKGKLEELCRQLQKLNKQVREESFAKIRLLETERQTAVEQLKVTLKDIEKSMNEGRERSDTLALDNKRLAEKMTELGAEYEKRLNSIAETYKTKDVYYEDLTKAKNLEIQLLKAKLEVAGTECQKASIEKEELTRTLIEGTARVGSAIENERVLREQVKQYADRYSELTKSLTSSNATFDKFKKEVDKVNTNMRKVETDALKWKSKYDESSQKVLVLTMSNKDLEDRVTASEKKAEKLENLCRALTARANPSADSPLSLDNVTIQTNPDSSA